ncbi:MAG: bifunctional adenosylcobinamide kinase/adenosylcobinamide-phosphate guanylyltransferase [Oscillospiraceae bacterium]|nr:bifunctional adenosylcobinamide kinase/adenosylcobinamide-phosphate guanylyltransferase [Oscillospiraceae bacterium]MBR7074040.1 bifunctional adenosylcobinamide kinase/adenosylcobinamide-phosphate guanylyltransferase [Oscillospiraceae bacterium]
MIFVTGPLYAGKKEYIRNALHLSEAEFAARAVWDAQEQALNADLPALADRLSEKEIVISTEIGGGLVPIDKTEREKREAAGRLACLLAERADTVVRVCCGLGQILKGELP